MNWMRRTNDWATTGDSSGIYVIERDGGAWLVDNRSGKPRYRGPFGGPAAAMEAAVRLPARAA